jgi:hypothetical protein
MTCLPRHLKLINESKLFLFIVSTREDSRNGICGTSCAAISHVTNFMHGDVDDCVLFELEVDNGRVWADSVSKLSLSRNRRVKN